MLAWLLASLLLPVLSIRRAFDSEEMVTDMTLSLGSSFGINGIELNFWMRPKTPAATTAEYEVFSLVDKFVYTLEYDDTIPEEMTLRCYKGNKDGVENVDYVKQESVIPVNTLVSGDANDWLNINVIIKFSFFFEANIYEGVDYESMKPKYTHYFDSIGSISSMQMKIQAAFSGLGVNFGEFRVFKQSSDVINYGQWLKYTDISTVPSTFTALHQEIHVSSGSVLYKDLDDTDIKETWSSSTTDEIIWIQCPFGQAPVSSALCEDCSQTGCGICQTGADDSYDQICRYCDPDSEDCAIDLECPDDYYLSNGSCKRCKIGCKRCNDWFECTSCDAGLVMVLTDEGYEHCLCPSDQFGTENFNVDQLICNDCNANCLTCNITASTCTSCASPNFLQGEVCVGDCTTAISNSWPDLTSRVCELCVNDCLTCTSLDCGDCDIAFNYYNGDCVNTCPTDTLEDIVLETCTDCDDGCASCTTTISTCLTCEFGYFLDVNICVTECPFGQYPDSSSVCTPCVAECTSCDSLDYCLTCAATKYFLLNSCIDACSTGYYPEDNVPGFLFCRECPSNCVECTDEDTCTTCSVITYLHEEVIDPGIPYSIFSCLDECELGTFPNDLTQTCDLCMLDCRNCTDITSCDSCSLGLMVFTDFIPPIPVTSCEAVCPSTFFANIDNHCQQCGADCDVCEDQETCSTCLFGFVLQQGRCQLLCDDGFYDNSGDCEQCDLECTKCTSAATCTDCIEGYELDTGDCDKLCGNGVRNQFEQCDDKNDNDGDGCSSTCQVEDGYFCWPENSNASKKDVCVCDPQLISANWEDYWGTISIKFATPIVYSEDNSTPKSNDAKQFCKQILKADTYSELGTDYSCILRQDFFDDSIYELNIYLDSDSDLASDSEDFETIIELQDGALQTQDCDNSIPTEYEIRNLPLSSPSVEFSLSSGSNEISQCGSELIISLAESKGLTKRDIKVTWTVVDLDPGNSSLVNDLEDEPFKDYEDQLSLVLSKDFVERLDGYELTIEAEIENFLGNKGSNQTVITFLGQKQIQLVDIKDTYTMNPKIENQLLPRFRFPYCDGESVSDANSLILEIITKCYLYNNLKTFRIVELPSCIIPAEMMNLGTQYSVLINAYHIDYPDYSLNKFTMIDTTSQNVEVASIWGSNRLFSVKKNFTFRAILNIESDSVTFNWYCIDRQSGGAPCFDQNFQFINFADSAEITVPGYTFLPGSQFDFELYVEDSISGTTSQAKFSMFAASYEQQDSVIDVYIQSESNILGYINLQSAYNSWKGLLIDADNQSYTHDDLIFSWEIVTSGQSIDGAYLNVFNNSIGIASENLEQNSIYTVKMNVTDGVKLGECYQIYRSNPEISFEFRVFPEEVEALGTKFAFVLTQQQPLVSLNEYSYGYVDESGNLIPLFQRTQLKQINSLLPPLSAFATGATSGQIKCFVHVIRPSGSIKTLFYSIVVTPPSSTISDFTLVLQTAMVDDLIESVQIAGGVQALQIGLTNYQKSLSIERILDGLEVENVKLNDLFIQESVASLLQISSSLLSDAIQADPTLLTRMASIFNKLVREQNNSQENYSAKYKEKTAQLLLQFADVVLNQDFSEYVGTGEIQDANLSIYENCIEMLKGTIHNRVLGTDGGFSFQGQLLVARTIMCKFLNSS